MNTFEDFLRECLRQGHTQVKLVSRTDEHDRLAFYAVGQNGYESSKTFDGVVVNDDVVNMEQPSAPEEFPDEADETDLSEGIDLLLGGDR